MNKTPKFSIITPSYNRAGYIEFCIKSVRNQTFIDFEHIVIDGGSTDGTVSILKEYEAKYNLTWISEPDNGMYDAINKGIKLAKGEIIACLNTDDAYLPWTLEVANRELSSGKDIIFGDLLIIKKRVNKQDIYLSFHRKFNKRYYTYFAPLAHPTIFIKKTIIDKLGYYETSYKLLADCEYWLRCVSKNYIPQKVHEVMAIQLDHQGSLRESYSKILKEEFISLRKKYGKKSIYNHYLIGKLQRVLTIRYYRLLFLLQDVFNTTDKWKKFREYSNGKGTSYNLAYSILACFGPGFIINRTKFSQFPVKLIEQIKGN